MTVNHPPINVEMHMPRGLPADGYAMGSGPARPLHRSNRVVFRR
jgi:hypothetical protein